MKMKRVVLLDLDGVLVKNKKMDLFEDSISFINFLREKKIPFRVVSNNSKLPPSEILKILKQKGLILKEQELITALSVAPKVLKKFKKVFAIGEEPVINYLKKHGINLVEDYRVDAVFIAQDKNINFHKIKTAVSALRLSGAKLIGVNLNKLAKDNDGLYYPAVGGFVKMFAYVTDYPEEEIISLGKPSKEFFMKALENMEVDKNTEIIFVSDDFYTDLIPAEKLGFTTVFLSTGKYTLEDLKKSQYKPKYTFSSLTELKRLFEN
jgi:4-nitrophenyl phosphatase